MGNLDRPPPPSPALPPPQSKDGKMARGMGVCCSSLFCPVASCSGQWDEGNKLVRATEISFTDVDNTMNRWGWVTP